MEEPVEEKRAILNLRLRPETGNSTELECKECTLASCGPSTSALETAQTKTMQPSLGTFNMAA